MVTNFILTFAYDPMGQRISKTKQVNTTVTKSYYFRDAQGQILQVMNSTVEADGTPQYSFEYPVYGSSRLGTKYPSISTTDFPKKAKREAKDNKNRSNKSSGSSSSSGGKSKQKVHYISPRTIQ